MVSPWHTDSVSFLGMIASPLPKLALKPLGVYTGRWSQGEGSIGMGEAHRALGLPAGGGQGICE